MSEYRSERFKENQSGALKDIGSIGLLKRLVSFLPSSKKKILGFLFAGSIVAAMAEMFSLACIALFASSIANPKAVIESSYYKEASSYFPQLEGLAANDLVIVLGVAVTILVLFKNLIRGLVQYFYGRCMAFIAGYCAESMLIGIMGMPYEWFLKRNSADLIMRVHWARVSGQTLGSVLLSLSDIFLLIMMVSILLFANPGAVLSAMVMLVIPSLFFSFGFRKAIDRLAHRQADYEQAANRELTMALHGLKDVRVLGMEEAFCEKFKRNIYAIPRCQAAQDIFTGIPGWGLEVCGFGMLSVLTFVMYSGSEASAAAATGTIALLAVSAWRGLPAVIRIVNYYNLFRSRLPIIERTVHYMSEIEKNAAGKVDVRHEGMSQANIEIDAVSFRYDGAERDVLQSISFHVGKGESVGIIGESGAGKSTLADLLIGLLEPCSGSIRGDGNILSEAERIGMAGYVPQAPYIYDASLAENVAFGLEYDAIDMSRVRDVCKLADVDGFVTTLPAGYKTQLGERGTRLSGGQQQRICIARALYRDPSMLIFDEATSSLDSKSERQIQRTINDLKGTVTMVIVAHRLSTIEHCDRLVWIENGEVLRVGPPEDILPLYKKSLASS